MRMPADPLPCRAAPFVLVTVIALYRKSCAYREMAGAHDLDRIDLKKVTFANRADASFLHAQRTFGEERRGNSNGHRFLGRNCERGVAITLACKAGSRAVPEPPDDSRIFISWHKLHKHSVGGWHVEPSSRATSKQTNRTPQPKAATRKKDSKRPERQR